MPPERSDKYAALEANADVKRWLANLACAVHGEPLLPHVDGTLSQEEDLVQDGYDGRIAVAAFQGLVG